MRADRTRREVARAHTDSTSVSSSCYLLLSTATSLSPLSPPSPSPMPSSPSTLPPSRYVGLCGVRLTNPPLNPVPRRSPRSLLPAACPSTGPRNRSLPVPSYPTYRLPHYPAASNPSPSPLYPFARHRPAGRLLFALRDSALSVSSLFLVPVLPSLSLSPSPSPNPSCRSIASRRPMLPPSGNQHTRKPCAARTRSDTTASRLSFVRSYVARVCMCASEGRR